MANLLTTARLILIVPVCWAILQPNLMPPWSLLLLLVLAVASDYFDGIVARHLGTASPRGQLFDHGTDCCFVSAALTSGAITGLIPWLLPPLVVIAFSQYVLDSHFLHRQKTLRMSTLGKWNGVLYFVPLFLLAAAQLPFSPEAIRLLEQTTTLLCGLLIISTIASIIDRVLAPSAWQ
ncbi:MAG: CDP-alcohol phosphatidyltransferase family protein [Pseudohongiellaceae bacterium]